MVDWAVLFVVWLVGWLVKQTTLMIALLVGSLVIQWARHARGSYFSTGRDTVSQDCVSSCVDIFQTYSQLSFPFFSILTNPERLICMCGYGLST
jgi:hypothetical protein